MKKISTPSCKPMRPRLLAVLLLALAMAVTNPFSAKAANVPVAKLSGSDGNKTLTFTFADEETVDGTTVFGVQDTKGDQPWGKVKGDITTVVIDASFASARPVTMRGWFANMHSLASISGLENLNTSEVVNMSAMFGGSDKLTALDLSHFDTRKVTDMSQMFAECEALTSVNLSSFNTANVTKMTKMFYGCTKLAALDVTKFNTGKVTDMALMFYGCGQITKLDISNFTITAASNVDRLMATCYRMAELNIGGNDFKVITAENKKYIAFGSMGNTGSEIPVKLTINDTFDKSVLGEKAADGSYSWLGGRFVLDEVIEVPVAKLSGSDGNKTLTFTFANKEAVDETTVFGVQSTKGAQPWEKVKEDITTVVIDASFAKARPVTMRGWFVSMPNLTSINGLENLNTSEVVSMDVMFAGSKKLTTLDLSHFDTGKVTDMSQMFAECEALTSVNLSSFNTANVTKMTKMFYNCTKLAALDVTNFNTEKVTDMALMFYGCEQLTKLDISDFKITAASNVDRFIGVCYKMAELNVGDNDLKVITNDDKKYNAFLNLGNTGSETPVKLTISDTFDKSVLGEKAADGSYYWLGGHFVLNEEGATTGINTVNTAEATQANGPRYNLSGQRVGNDYRGLVIQNGRKFFATGK